MFLINLHDFVEVCFYLNVNISFFYVLGICLSQTNEFVIMLKNVYDMEEGVEHDAAHLYPFISHVMEVTDPAHLTFIQNDQQKN